ncbi:MAG: hypothetical protein EOP54_01430 [Sphingobacteriales bacterium]|nr:MAG: hypothetical protein EOP54_01430 [Sphingobacteriales bacterium]
MNSIKQHNFNDYRSAIVKVTMLYFMGIFLLRLCSRALPFQLNQPVLHNVNFDFTEGIFVASGLSGFLLQNTVANWIFSLSLFLLPVLCFFKSSARWPFVLFSLVFFIYTLFNNLYVTHQQHYLHFAWIISIPFVARPGKGFDLLWQGVRYYACWFYTMAFLLKVINGSFFQEAFGEITIKTQMASYIFAHPHSVQTHLYTWLLQHPFWLNAGAKFTFLLEGVFIIGFFTRKSDKWLTCAGFLIFAFTAFSSDVFFIEQFVAITIAFTSPAVWQKWGRWLSFKSASEDKVYHCN